MVPDSETAKIDPFYKTPTIRFVRTWRSAP